MTSSVWEIRVKKHGWAISLMIPGQSRQKIKNKKRRSKPQYIVFSLKALEIFCSYSIFVKR
jgi:hypothetical protein